MKSIIGFSDEDLVSISESSGATFTDTTEDLMGPFSKNKTKNHDDNDDFEDQIHTTKENNLITTSRLKYKKGRNWILLKNTISIVIFIKRLKLETRGQHITQ